MPNQKIQPLITRSELFKVAFYSREKQRHPDIVDFFNFFGLKIFVGTIDIDAKIEGVTNVTSMFKDFNTVLEQWPDDQGWPATNIPPEISTAYFTKHIYQDFLLGKSWHTPITAFYKGNTDTFVLTKGAKKILASKLVGISKIPAIVTSHEKKIANKKLRLIKTDQELYEFIKSVGKEHVENPFLGIEYHDINGVGKIPIIHWISISKETSLRDNYHKHIAKDRKLWSKFPKKIITSDVMPAKLIDRYDHKLLSGLPMDVTIIRSNMPKEAVAHIWSAKDRDVCSTLANALAWLAVNANLEFVGEAVSSCGRYRIIYNNNSDVRTEIPHGILNK